MFLKTLNNVPIKHLWGDVIFTFQGYFIKQKPNQASS